MAIIPRQSSHRETIQEHHNKRWRTEKHLPPAAVKGFFSSKCSNTDSETEPRHCSSAALAHRHSLSHGMSFYSCFLCLCRPVWCEIVSPTFTQTSVLRLFLALPPPSPPVLEISTSTFLHRAGAPAQPQPRLAQLSASLQEHAPKRAISSWESRAGNFQSTPACFSITSQILVLQPPTPVKHIPKSPSHLLYLRLT